MEKSASDYWPSEIKFKENNWLFTHEELNHSPSFQNNISKQIELQTYKKCMKTIINLSQALHLKKSVIFLSMLYIYRFFQRKSVNQYNPLAVTLAACFLSAKTFENHRKSDDFALVMSRIQANNDKIDKNDQLFWKWRDSLFKMEEVVIDVLCFDMEIMNPYEFITDLLSKSVKDEESSGDDNFYNNHHLEKHLTALMEKVSLCQIFLIYDIKTVLIALLLVKCDELKIRVPRLFFKEKLGMELDLNLYLEVIDTLIGFEMNFKKYEAEDFNVLLNEGEEDNSADEKVAAFVKLGKEMELKRTEERKEFERKEMERREAERKAMEKRELERKELEQKELERAAKEKELKELKEKEAKEAKEASVFLKRKPSFTKQEVSKNDTKSSIFSKFKSNSHATSTPVSSSASPQPHSPSITNTANGVGGSPDKKRKFPQVPSIFSKKRTAVAKPPTSSNSSSEQKPNDKFYLEKLNSAKKHIDSGSDLSDLE